MSISLYDVRSEFLSGYIDINEVVSRYRGWLSWIFYVLCYRFNYQTCDHDFMAFRGLKRGDSRYSEMVCHKFDLLIDSGRHLKFFGYGSHGRVRGSGLHMVLEYDANSIGLLEAWLAVSADFNRFMSRIRKRFGKVSVVRVWESHESGYPHVHVLLIFHSYVFDGYSSRRRGNLIYRVFGSNYRLLKSYWVLIWLVLL